MGLYKATNKVMNTVRGVYLYVLLVPNDNRCNTIHIICLQSAGVCALQSSSCLEYLIELITEDKNIDYKEWGSLHSPTPWFVWFILCMGESELMLVNATLIVHVASESKGLSGRHGLGKSTLEHSVAHAHTRFECAYMAKF